MLTMFDSKGCAPGGYLACLHTGVCVPCFGSEISLESHIFGCKIFRHKCPILFFFGGGGGGGIKNFQQLPFSLSLIM